MIAAVAKVRALTSHIPKIIEWGRYDTNADLYYQQDVDYTSFTNQAFFHFSKSHAHYEHFSSRLLANLCYLCGYLKNLTEKSSFWV